MNQISEEFPFKSHYLEVHGSKMHYIDVGEGRDRPVSPDDLVKRVRAVLKYKPKTPIMVRGDAGVAYGRVVETMVLLQAAGTPSVGLITEPPES